MTSLAGIRAAWGATLLLAPDSLLRAVNAGVDDARTRWVTRVLGARELTQAMLAVRYHSRAASLGGAAVDATHAGTMLALAIWRPAYRRPAAASALTAATFAMAGLRQASHAPHVALAFTGGPGTPPNRRPAPQARRRPGA